MLVAGVSCRQQDADNTVETITVDINAADDPGEIFDSYEYVMLETTDDNLIGDIEKIEITSDRIYILDQWGAKAKACYIFDRKGKYIGKIDKVGRGPGEYFSIGDIQVCDGLIYLLARENNSIMVYTETGEFVRAYRFKDPFNHFLLVNDGLMWLSSEQSNDTEYNFMLYDPANEKYVSQVDYFKKRDGFIVRYSPFNKMDNGEIYVTKRFDHTIYSLGEDALIPLYTMQFNTKDQIPEDYDQIPAAELYDRLSTQGVVKYIDRVVKKGDELIITFDENDRIIIFNHLIRYNTKTGKQLHFKLDYDYDAKKYPLLSNPVYIGSDYMISCTSAMAALDLEEYYSWGLFNEEMLSPEDNPVLFFWKFK
jgi:hypothetical protein